MFKRSESTKFYKTPIPSVVYTRFKCQDTWTISTVARLNLYANNPYDPVVGVSTSACSGFPQLMAIWRYCICFGCKVATTSVLISGTGSHAYIYIAYDDHFGTMSAATITRDYIREHPQNLRSKAVYSSSYLKAPVRLSFYKKIKAIEHKKELEPQIYALTNAGGLTANALCFAYVGLVPGGSTTAGVSADIDVTITYWCKLYDRIPVDA